MRFVPARIHVDHIQIKNADHGSDVSFGSTVIRNRNVVAKKTQGFGQQLADAVSRRKIVSYVADDDRSDGGLYKKELRSARGHEQRKE
ncbi:hypothetical protein [Cohnella sp. REN36]|uniref:hypothetical protein n=1 Tax=Cohnella sp. REN36 TaxID=2887347 RepID=UPI001D1366AC|nr:hypothetical protein [Cohnella sp. REN36]MCC3373295.1 hypothetical protein [Cohnella sp. REN36]